MPSRSVLRPRFRPGSRSGRRRGGLPLNPERSETRTASTESGASSANSASHASGSPRVGRGLPGRCCATAGRLSDIPARSTSFQTDHSCLRILRDDRAEIPLVADFLCLCVASTCARIICKERPHFPKSRLDLFSDADQSEGALWPAREIGGSPSFPAAIRVSPSVLAAERPPESGLGRAPLWLRLSLRLRRPGREGHGH
jgi:hypothetical protein